MKEILLVTASDGLGNILTRYASGRLSIKLSIIAFTGKAFSILKQRAYANVPVARIIIDTFLPDQDAFDFAQQMKLNFPDLEIFGLTTDPVVFKNKPDYFHQVFLAPYDKSVYIRLLTI